MRNIDPYQDLWDALNKTGVRWRRGQRKTGHHIILPISNLKPWTKEEQILLEKAARDTAHIHKGFKYEITYNLVRPDWTDYKVNLGFGFRIYSIGK